MLKPGLQARIPALRDASWYQAEFSDHLCCSLMSNTSAHLSLTVRIRRVWASFPLPRLSCRNFTSCLLTSGVLPGTFRPYQWKLGTPDNQWRWAWSPKNSHFSGDGVGFELFLEFHPAFNQVLIGLVQAAQHFGGLPYTYFHCLRVIF